MNLDIISLVNPKAIESEAYRTLRTNLQFSNIDNPLKVIAVTSSGQSEGKSTTISNLAVSYAQMDQRVLLLDTDLRRPNVHKIFKKPNLVGLTSVLTQGATLDRAILPIMENLDIMTCGIIPPNPAELLSSQKFKELIETLSSVYDIVLIDSPPVGVVADAAIISTVIDGMIFVVAAGQTESDHAKHALKLLDNAKVNVLGTVITKAPISKKGYYGYQYCEYSEETSKKKKRFLN